MTPYDTYVNTAKLSMSDREIEASALTKAALLLKQCQQNWQAPERDRKLIEALEFNQKLWSIFQASLVEPDHPMPPALRQDILSLARFIDQRTFDVMAFPEPEKLAVIIQINLNMAGGLRDGATVETRKPAEAESREMLREEPVWA